MSFEFNREPQPRRSDRLQILMTPQEAESVRRAAYDCRLSLSDFVRRVVLSYIQSTSSTAQPIAAPTKALADES